MASTLLKKAGGDEKIQNDCGTIAAHAKADTHGQSTTIFALAYWLGIDLMPRIQSWQDLTLYRPSPDAKYQHIDLLFTDHIDWDLIERHWQDMMQVAISIQQKRLLPSALLRKLGYRSRKNHLYQAFQELGRGIRTLFLLRYISDVPMRRQILTTTNKVEAYHDF
jgi:TnpA family transposase